MPMPRAAWIAAACLSLWGGAAAAQQRYPLWDGGVPGFESRAAIPEEARDYWTRNVNNPSVTAYLPDPARATGTGIVIVPGGGHNLLVTAGEGDAVAKWLTDRGVAAFVLRYRLFRAKGSPYTLDDARADTERALRFVRSRANGFGITRLGVIGFSAGGELARMATLSDPVKPRGKGDKIDLFPARPDFAILIFPGPLHGDERVAKDAPPVFLAAANDDTCCSQPPIDILKLYRDAGASAELHIYRAGGHAYNLGERTDLLALKHSPQQIEDWLSDSGFLGHPAPPTEPHLDASPPGR
jgi:acetyl esterase/lipase